MLKSNELDYVCALNVAEFLMALKRRQVGGEQGLEGKDEV